MKVSVVIPTIGRDLLITAILSALNQTLKPAEVIVCYDGDDFEIFKHSLQSNEQLLNKQSDIKIINVGPFNGGNNARQTGVEISAGDYIALLDDDDFWAENHLSDYNEFVSKSNGFVVCTCHVNVLGITPPLTLPQRNKQQDETISEYLFKINSIRPKLGYIQSSLLFFSKELALIIPFQRSLRYHQDIDWLVRLDQSNVSFSFYQSPHVTVFYNFTPDSVSKKISCYQSIEWASGVFLSKRILGDFILMQPLQMAINNSSVRDVFNVFKTAYEISRPGLWASLRAMIKIVGVLFKFMKNIVKN